MCQYSKENSSLEQNSFKWYQSKIQKGNGEEF